MKKPRVEYINWEPFVVQTESGNYLNNRESVEAYKEMIDALIDLINHVDKTTSGERARIKAIKALKSAGCEHE